MKKIMILVLTMGTILALAGCGNTSTTKQSGTAQTTSQAVSADTDTSNTDNGSLVINGITPDPVVEKALKEDDDFVKNQGGETDKVSEEFLKTHPAEVYGTYLGDKIKGDFSTMENSKELASPKSIKYEIEVDAGTTKERHEIVVELQSDKTFKVTSDNILN